MAELTTSRDYKGSRTWLRVFGVVHALIGTALYIRGVELLELGGSGYYLLIGTGLIVSGVLFFMRVRAGVWLFAALFVATMMWALWEAGFNFWPQAARMIGLAF